MEDNTKKKTAEGFSLEEAWDDEATRHGYDNEILEALLSLSLVTAVSGSLKTIKGLLQVVRVSGLLQRGRAFSAFSGRFSARVYDTGRDGGSEATHLWLIPPPL